MQMDKVMVMESEFDSPTALLDNPRSKFSRMIAKSAELDLTELRNLANKRSWGTKAISGKRIQHSSVQNSKETYLIAQSSSENLEDQSIDSTSSKGNSDSESTSKMPRSLGNLFAPPTDGRNSLLQSNIDHKLPNKSKTHSLDFTSIIPQLSVETKNATTIIPSWEAYKQLESTNANTNEYIRLSLSNSLSSTPNSKSAHLLIGVDAQMKHDDPMVSSPVSDPTAFTQLLNNRHYSSTDSINDSEVSMNSSTRLWSGQTQTRNSSQSSGNGHAESILDQHSFGDNNFREDMTDNTKSSSPNSPTQSLLAELFTIRKSESPTS
ncbi:hypothetical protein HK096_009038 [Nowakowskiella sp. JEL0078]|nr:hypothetical protein HK096_009038 [Nowakowskiella sp. JEL0078]